MAVSTTIQYAILLGITIFFSAFSLVIQDKMKALTFNILAALCWFIFALTHFISGSTNDPLTYGLTSLFVMFGIIFALYGIHNFSQMKHERVYGFMED